jgi:hypothetical protein
MATAPARADFVALIGPTARDARAAAARLRRERARGLRFVPTTLSGYLAACTAPPASVMLVAGGRDRDEDRRFLRATRERLLWKRPVPEVYAAISGLRTDVPAPRRGRKGSSVSDSVRPPHLLLEGTVTASRALSALRSPVRDWIVEHVGRVELSDAVMARLGRQGVRWWVLWPVRLSGVVDRRGASRPLRPRASARSSARRRRPSRR